MSTPGVMQALCVSASGILAAEFSGSATHFARFDDFSFSGGGAPPRSSPQALISTLDPAMLVLLGLLLAVIAATTLRGQR